MSYDYNKLLGEINNYRKKAYENCVLIDLSSSNENNNVNNNNIVSYPSSIEHYLSSSTTTKPSRTQIKGVHLDSLNEAIELYGKLSSFCPLPPLLWLQYACDAGILLEESLQTVNENNDDENKLLYHEQQKDVIETRIEILETGKNEFPGSKMLHRFYLEELIRYYYCFYFLVSQNNNEVDSNQQKEMEEIRDRIIQSFQDSIQWVCSGSHYADTDDNTNDEDGKYNDLYSIWKTFRDFLQVTTLKDSYSSSETANTQKLLQQMYLHRSKIPFKTINDTLSQEITFTTQHYFSHQKWDSEFFQTIEMNRREASTQISTIESHESNILEQMTREGIITSPISSSSLSKGAPIGDSNTKAGNGGGVYAYSGLIVLRPSRSSFHHHGYNYNSYYLMGFGGQNTASAFVKYAKHYASHNNSDNANGDYKKVHTDNTISMNNTLKSIRIYERGISECPTVDNLWIAYLNFLIRIFSSTDSSKTSTLTKNTPVVTRDFLQKSSERAVRNCPYSLPLWKLKMNIHSLLVSHPSNNSNTSSAVDAMILNVDDLMEIAKDAIETKFLMPSPNAQFEILLEVSRVMNRYLLNTILSNNTSDVKDSDYDDDDSDEDKLDSIQDGIDDLREAFDSIHTYINKSPIFPKNNTKKDKKKKGNNNHVIFSIKRNLLKERALMEANVIYPVLQQYPDLLLQEEEEEEGKRVSTNTKKGSSVKAPESEAIKWFEKLVKFNPKNMLYWKDYIAFQRLVLSSVIPSISPLHSHNNGSKIKENKKSCNHHHHHEAIRDLYQRAIHSITFTSFEDIPTTTLDTDQSQSQQNSELSQSLENSLFASILQTKEENDSKEDDATLLIAKDDFSLSGMLLFFHEYLSFEQNFGTLENIRHATYLIKRKIASQKKFHQQNKNKRKNRNNRDNNSSNKNNSSGLKKRQWDETQSQSSLPQQDHQNNVKEKVSSSTVSNNLNNNKRVKVNHSSSEKQQQEEEAQEKKKEEPSKIDPQEKPPSLENASTAPTTTVLVPDTILIGGLKYPVHPYTIRLSNLSLSTQDMDIVDFFQSTFPQHKIVHCRILREKHHQKQQHYQQQQNNSIDTKGKSKGIALIQFEEKESVQHIFSENKKKNNIISSSSSSNNNIDHDGDHEMKDGDDDIIISFLLDGNELKLEPSHIPAVSSIVPPGMHKVNPKGQGKRSKYNENRKKNKKNESHNFSKGYENEEAVSKTETMVEQKTKREEEAENKESTIINDIGINPKTTEVTKTATSTKGPSSKKKKVTNFALAFQPRSVTSRNQQKKKKKKINLSDTK